MLNNQKKGFTLLEGILAIFIITLGVGGAYALISQTISFGGLSSQKLIATYLAQEGIEIVRNIRDTNWLEGENWKNGLGPGDWEGDYNMTQNLLPSANRFLNIDGNGFYGYSGGTKTPFKRKINLSYPQDDILKVIVEVEWKERLRTHKVSAQENLYNWLK